MNLTTQPFKQWTDIRISLSAEDISKINPAGAEIRLMIRPNGDSYLVAGPELVSSEPSNRTGAPCMP